MALQCNMTLSSGSMVAGQSPAPQATLTVYNPNAAAVLVSGARVSIATASGQQMHAGSSPLVPLIAGFSTVPALSSLTFGPFPVAIGSAAAGSQAQMVPPSTQPVNPQASQPLQTLFAIGATVYGSDGSVNTAGTAPLLLSYFPPPPPNFQGGPLQFSQPNNTALGFLTGVL